MTHEEIIEMARQALKQEPREDWNSTAWVFADETLEAFAKLVAEKERDACAELVWPKLKIWSEEEQRAMGLAFNKAQQKNGWYETLMAFGASVLKMKAAAIRARGQA